MATAAVDAAAVVKCAPAATAAAAARPGTAKGRWQLPAVCCAVRGREAVLLLLTGRWARLERPRRAARGAQLRGRAAGRSGAGGWELCTHTRLQRRGLWPRHPGAASHASNRMKGSGSRRRWLRRELVPGGRRQALWQCPQLAALPSTSRRPQWPQRS